MLSVTIQREARSPAGNTVVHAVQHRKVDLVVELA